jgi:hypothetical protein
MYIAEGAYFKKDLQRVTWKTLFGESYYKLLILTILYSEPGE